MKRKTKIICTIGPSVDNRVMIEKLIDAGMNVARLNFSHANHQEHSNRIRLVRELASEKNKIIGIMADTKGPEIRIGSYKNGSVNLKKGQKFVIFNSTVEGNEKQGYINVPELFNDIDIGDYILVDDGKVRLDVIKKEEGCLICSVFNSGKLKSNKGVNVPNVKLTMPFLSSKDKEDIIFSVKNGVDMLALSFVRRKEDVVEVKELLKSLNSPNVEIIAKIENQEGVDNLDEIMNEVNGVMVARGDLGVEVSTQMVPIFQKKIIAKANQLGKPVITATHMLESMMTSPRPTRAEANDIANAILDGSDAIMLSGETAAGEYPIESVLTMDTIAKAIEKTIDYEEKLSKAVKFAGNSVSDAIGVAVAQASLTLPKAEVIMAFTETGGTAKRLSRFRPSVPIIAITDSKKTARKLTYYCGVYSSIQKESNDISEYDRVAKKVAIEKLFKKGTTIIITSGWAQRHGTTNTLRIIDVD